MRITKFEELDIWKLSLEVTRDIYDITAKERFSHDFCLRDQIRRAVISISSNIVEGFEKNNNNEFIRFLKISKGSIGETKNQLYIALAVKYVAQEEFDSIGSKLDRLSSGVGRLTVYLDSHRPRKTTR